MATSAQLHPRCVRHLENWYPPPVLDLPRRTLTRYNSLQRKGRLNMTMVIVSVIGLVAGVGLVILLSRYNKKRQLKEIELQGADLIEKAQEQAADLEEELQAFAKEIEDEAWEKARDELDKLEQRFAKLSEALLDKEELGEENLKTKVELFNVKNSLLNQRLKQVQARESRYRQSVEKIAQLKADLLAALEPRSGRSRNEILAQLSEATASTLERKLREEILRWEEEASQITEREAKRLLQLALNRFARPYCPERGIGYVEFANPDHMERFLANNSELIRGIEMSCGVDISINKENLSASVLGFDPVRRELGRSVFERMTHEKHPQIARIAEVTERCKRELYKRIKQDGDRVTRELNLRDLDGEIKNMLGALRYRYSFAQNQHFHCAEVGWLCGLLAVELGELAPRARRAGLLHDIGKAMDHSKEGGHAIIGADFIDKHGEAADIVHAVRAHHYDEQPQTVLAYLVIAADAISGARPGARRSTVDSYTQKMADLEKIGMSFQGVLDTYILSAGREVRVIVDSEKVDDLTALSLSKSIAQRIEEECSYPGLIKVTVVRKTQSVELAR